MDANQARRALNPLAESQRGMFTTKQAARFDVSRLDLSRMETNGDIERITQGVYRMGGAPYAAHTDLCAHWLALDPGHTGAERVADRSRIVAASHRSAASVYGIGDLPASTHTFTSSHRKQSTRTAVHISHRGLDPDDVRIEGGMLVTTPARTIADLYRTEGDLSHVADVLADAIEEGLTSRDAVIAKIDGRTEASRAKAVDSMLQYRGLDTASLAARIARSRVGTGASHQDLQEVPWGTLHDVERLSQRT